MHPPAGQPLRRALLTAAIVTLFDISTAFARYFGIGALVERFARLRSILGSTAASFLWFFGGTILISCFSARFNDRLLRIVNVVCGGIIILYGGKLFLQFFRMLL